MLTIQQLREKRNAKAKAARKILDDAGDNFNAETHGKELQAIYDEIEQIDAEIAFLTRQADLEARLEMPTDEEVAALRIGSGASRNTLDAETALVARDREIFDRWLRHGPRGLSAEDFAHVRSRPRADQSSTVPSEGGYTVPRDFVAVLLQRLKAFGGIRNVATVIQTAGGNPMNWPTVDETNEEGEIVAENQPATSSEFTFGTVELGAYKYSSKVISIPIELLQDTGIDLVGFTTQALATRIARITSKHFVVGTGNAQPQGYTTPAPAVPQAAAGPIEYVDLVNLEHSVDPAYRSNPSVRWAFHDNTLRDLKKLTDDQGRPLWLPGMAASFESGFPDTILGYRYQIMQEMATMAGAVGSKVIGFGAFSYYYIRDIMAATLFRFEDSAFMIKGQVGFLSWSRHDGDRIDVAYDAIKCLTKA